MIPGNFKSIIVVTVNNKNQSTFNKKLLKQSCSPKNKFFGTEHFATRMSLLKNLHNNFIPLQDKIIFDAFAEVLIKDKFTNLTSSK